METHNPERIFMTEASLTELLLSAGIPLEQWGTGVAKTLQHLLDEINSGETRIERDEATGKLSRHTSVLWLDVIGTDQSGRRWHLREERQVFVDGRERRRKLDNSIGEKMKPGETYQTAAVRALQEELGVTHCDEPEHLGERSTIIPSPDTFPGLESHFEMQMTRVELPPSAFNPDGYTEVQPDKTTYFVWEPVNE